MEKKITLYSTLLSCIFVFGFFIFSNRAEAADATLFLSPPSGTYQVGGTFPVSLRVNTGTQAINAADAILVFDPAKIQVQSVSKANSIFTLWVQEPVFSNSAGTISFAGGKPSPGYLGSSGEIITITFKVLTTGIASINFSSGSVLADDGKGTNILSSLISGLYTLGAREIETLPPEEGVLPPTPGQFPAAPVVSSPTHPEERKWYANNNPEFSWKLPSDIIGVSLLLNQSPIADPGPISDGLMSSIKFEDIRDGIWYFHIKFENQNGWGSIAHRKVLIDTSPPSPFEIGVERENPTDPQPIILFGTTDDLSGLAHYEIRIGPGDSFLVFEESTKESPYKLPAQAPGRHQITIKASDKAGNFALSSAEVQVFPIESPKILKIPRRIRMGEALEIEGTALPEVTVRIFIQKIREEPILSETKASPQGSWGLLYDKVLREGDYEIWAQAQDKRGALSYPTGIYLLEVGLPPFLKIGKIVIDYISIMLTLIVLVIGAVVALIYIRHRISVWRRRLRRETKEVVLSVAKAFKLLEEKVKNEVEHFDKRGGLTKKEKEVRDNLLEALEASRDIIGKEIEDVERELE
ncbi:MAG: cohesin domain-containing protein [Candidatus Aminicenantia bacterium]